MIKSIPGEVGGGVLWEIKDTAQSITYTFKCETAEEATSWIFQLQARTGEIQHINRLYPKCSDCDSPSPTYLSPSLAIALCEHCYSLFKSFIDPLLTNAIFLKLSSPNWTIGQIRLIKKISSDDGNSVWQYKVPPQWMRPSFQDPLNYIFVEAKEQWLRAKYVDRLFIQPLDVSKKERESTASMYIYEASLAGDAVAILRGIVWEGNGGWMSDTDKNCALHAASLEGHIECVEILTLSFPHTINQLNSINMSPCQSATYASTLNKPNSKKCKNVALNLSHKLKGLSNCPIYFAVCLDIPQIIDDNKESEKWFIYRLTDGETCQQFVLNIQHLYPLASISYSSVLIPSKLVSLNEKNDKSGNIIYILPVSSGNSLFLSLSYFSPSFPLYHTYTQYITE